MDDAGDLGPLLEPARNLEAGPHMPLEPHLDGANATQAQVAFLGTDADAE